MESSWSLFPLGKVEKAVVDLLMGLPIEIVRSQDLHHLMDGPVLNENAPEDRLFRLNILRRHFVGGDVFLLHPPLLLNDPDLEIGNDLRMELNRDHKHTDALQGFFEVDLFAVDFEAVLFEVAFNIHGGYRPKELSTFADGPGKGTGKCLDLLGHLLDILLRLGHTVLNQTFLMFQGFDILFRGQDGLLLGDQIVPSVTIRNLDQIPRLSFRGNIFQ
jgi:hypothetical protein